MRVVVIGGGIAGASAAFAIVSRAGGPEVVLVEAERELARHTTGRSAAQYIRNYGVDAVKALTVASYDFLSSPPSEFADESLLSARVRW